MRNISIVTGGASGLGLELTRELVSKGIDGCIIGRTAEKIDRAIAEIGKSVVGYCGDLCDEAFIKAVFYDLACKGYYVDYLYNCAGCGIFGAPVDMNLEKIQTVMDSNVVGLMCISYEACRCMTEGGTIINIMSTAGLKGNAGETTYCASKWAVRGFTEAMKAYYKGKNIHIIGVYPGGMNTPFWTPECGLNPDVSKFMDPSEVAKVIVFNVLERKTSYTADITIERK